MKTWDQAIHELRKKDEVEEKSFNDAVRANPKHWDGWPYGHFYRKAAEYLESLRDADVS